MNALEERILECFPSGSYALAGLLRLMDIVASDQVPTAAVECRTQPRMLINPEFVAKHASTPEQLLMLVMHELHHVLLGHTRLFRTTTRTDNFVFDCVINALISRMFPEPDHLRFLTAYYSDQKFPECLLRPPARWNGRTVPTLPKAIRDLPEEQLCVVAEVYRSLYSEAGVSYDELYEILPVLLNEGAVGAVPLIGGHEEDGATKGGFEERSPVLFDIVRGIVEEWPQPPDPIRGRSFGKVLKDSEVALRPVRGNRSILRGLLRRLGDRTAGGRARRHAEDPINVLTPVPHLDRRSVVLRALGTRPLLYAGSTTVRMLTPVGDKVHIYVDVSGSMNDVIDAVFGAVNDCRDWVYPKIHLFSDSISDATPEEIRRGMVRTTGGTHISCVAEHMAANKIRRACIITDGWVGKPKGGHLKTLTRAKLGVALVGNFTNTSDLSGVTRRTVTLTI